DREELREPAAALAEQVLCWHAAAVEREAVRVGRVPAHLAVGRLHGETRRACGKDDRTDLTGAGAGCHRDDLRYGRAGVRDERLLTVDHPFVRCLVERRLRSRATGVAARLGLGQTERADGAPRAQIGQPALLLLL